VDSEFRHHPGAIEAIAQHPADADQVNSCLLIARHFLKVKLLTVFLL